MYLYYLHVREGFVVSLMSIHIEKITSDLRDNENKRDSRIRSKTENDTPGLSRIMIQWVNDCQVCLSKKKYTIINTT